MKHTLVAAFDDLDAAQAAQAELIGLNIPQANIQLSSPDAADLGAETLGTTTTATTAPDRPANADESFGDKVSHFFGTLFGNDDDGQPHRHASAYPEAYKRGATLVTVTADSEEEADEVEAVLEKHGAMDIDERSSTWTDGAPGGVVTGSGMSHLAGTHQGTHAAAPVTDALQSDLSGTAAIPVIEEELRVGKREVDTGKVRVVQRVSTRPVEETVSLHSERADIERHPVDRPATAADLQNFKDGVVEIRETDEQAVVEKTARVVEEVTVGKVASDREETVRDNVRRTDVDIETSRQGEPLGAAASGERNAVPTERNTTLNDRNKPLSDR